jgi:hypothetical protein
LVVVDLNGEVYTYALFGDTAAMVLRNNVLKRETLDQRQLSFNTYDQLNTTWAID